MPCSPPHQEAKVTWGAWGGGLVAEAAVRCRGSLPFACSRGGISFDWKSNRGHLSPCLYGLLAAQLGWGAGSAHLEPALWGHDGLHPWLLHPRVPAWEVEGAGMWGALRHRLGGHSSCQEPPMEDSSARAAPGLSHAGQLSQLAAELAALSIIIIKN